VRLLNAVFDLDADRTALAYFSGNEATPLPDISATATGRLGLVGAFDVEPGPMHVAAAGLVDGQVVALGLHPVFVYPDTATLVTFRGLRPHQLPTP
jgi:hypothetical protein